MITIEASNINVGGSLNLLKLLIACCEEHKLQTTVYVSYDHVYKELIQEKLLVVCVKKTNIFQTLLRYAKCRSNVLFFCSLPPFVKNEASYVYFHSEYYANKIVEGYSSLSCYEIIKKIIYYFWIKSFAKNCVNFLCQTKRVAIKLNRTYGISAEVCPFYKPIVCDSIKKVDERQYDFFYPAIASKHKNHKILLKAVEELREKYSFSLLLTIPEDSVEQIKMINKINDKYPNTVLNFGVVPHKKVVCIMEDTKYLIYPSLMESMGLPLLEAIDTGMKVLVSDMDYAYSIINNPITFNPLSSDEIAECMKKALTGTYNQIEQSSKVSNSLEYIINILS